MRFLGAVKDIRSLYWASDVLVMPSLYEGLANAALEGCASGLPALLSRAANVDSIIRPGETGWQVPTLRHRPLAAALADVIVTPSQRLAAMGRAGRAHVVARFAPRKDHVLSDQMVAVYDELLRRIPRRRDRRPPGSGSRANGVRRPRRRLGLRRRDDRVRPVTGRGSTCCWSSGAAGRNGDQTDWNGRAILLDRRYKGKRRARRAPIRRTRRHRQLSQRGRRRQLDSSSAGRRYACARRTSRAGPSAMRRSSPTTPRPRRCWRCTAAQATTRRSRRAPATTRARPRRSPRAPGASPTLLARSVLHPFQIPAGAINHGGTREPRVLVSTASPATAFPAVSAPRTT